MLVSSFLPAHGGHPSVLINPIPSGDHLVPSYPNDGQKRVCRIQYNTTHNHKEGPQHLLWSNHVLAGFLFGPELPIRPHLCPCAQWKPSQGIFSMLVSGWARALDKSVWEHGKDIARTLQRCKHKAKLKCNQKPWAHYHGVKAVFSEGCLMGKPACQSRWVEPSPPCRVSPECFFTSGKQHSQQDSSEPLKVEDITQCTRCSGAETPRNNSPWCSSSLSIFAFFSRGRARSSAARGGGGVGLFSSWHPGSLLFLWSPLGSFPFWENQQGLSKSTKQEASHSCTGQDHIKQQYW